MFAAAVGHGGFHDAEVGYCSGLRCGQLGVQRVAMFGRLTHAIVVKTTEGLVRLYITYGSELKISLTVFEDPGPLDAHANIRSENEKRCNEK